MSSPGEPRTHESRSTSTIERVSTSKRGMTEARSSPRFEAALCAMANGQTVSSRASLSPIRLPRPFHVRRGLLAPLDTAGVKCRRLGGQLSAGTAIGIRHSQPVTTHATARRAASLGRDRHHGYAHLAPSPHNPALSIGAQWNSSSGPYRRGAPLTGTCACLEHFSIRTRFEWHSRRAEKRNGLPPNCLRPWQDGDRGRRLEELHPKAPIFVVEAARLPNRNHY